MIRLCRFPADRPTLVGRVNGHFMNSVPNGTLLPCSARRAQLPMQNTVVVRSSATSCHRMSGISAEIDTPSQHEDNYTGGSSINVMDGPR